MTALTDLIARLGEMTGPLLEHEAYRITAPIRFLPDAAVGFLNGALQGSLDAAVAFCEAALPGWRRYHSQTDNGFMLTLTSPDYEVDCWEAGDMVRHDVLAGSLTTADHAIEPLALVLAVLKALQARDGG